MTVSEFLNTFNKLKNQQVQLEKTELDLVKFIKTHIDSKVEDEYNEIQILREQEIVQVQKKVEEIMCKLKYIKYLISQDNVEEIDTSVLKDNMMSLQINLYSIKNHLKTEMENLIPNEYLLNSELMVTEEKLSDIRKQLANSRKCVTQSKQNILQDSPFFQEVQQFANYVKKFGGHEGGWAEEDHVVFLKIYKKNKNSDKIIKALHRIMPDISAADVEAHIEWYNQYLHLKFKQKNAIEEWRRNKANQEERVQKQVQNITRNSKKIIKKSDEDNNTAKQKLIQWKMQKQLKCQQSLEYDCRTQFRLKQIEKEKKDKRNKIKKEIQRWRNAVTAKQKDEQLEKEVASLREKERRAALANKLIKEFQHQDQYYINRRLSIIQTDSEKTAHVQKSGVNIPRDPARLLKPTKQWEARIAREERAELPKLFFGNISVKQIPKLGIPDWRKSVQ